MSFFTDEFDDLRTNQDFNSFVNDTTTYRQTTEYTEKINQKIESDVNAIRAHICKMINDHFNNNDQDTFDVTKHSITIYVNVLSEEDTTGLIDALTTKGYTCVLNGGFLTITASE